MSRPLSVIRGLVMLSMVFALMAAFTVNVAAAPGDVVATVNDDAGVVAGSLVTVTGDTAAAGSCTTDATGSCLVVFTTDPVDGEVLTGTASNGTDTGTGTVTFDITADPNTLPITIVAAPTATVITVNKVDQDGAVLPGACFSATGETSLVTVADCDINAIDLQGDGTTTLAAVFTDGETVTVSETTVPAGCTGGADQTFVEDDTVGTQTLNFTNVCTAVGTTGDITITKTDQDGNPLEGATFDATDAVGAALGSGTTDAAGVALISTGAVAGDVVTLTESVVPAGCTADLATQDVVIVDGGNTVPVTNTCGVVATGSDVFTTVVTSDDPADAGTSQYFVSGPVTGAAVTPAAGVTVTYTDDATAAVFTGVTDANGFVIVTLPAGTYTISNSAAPGTGSITVDGVSDYDVLIIVGAAVVTPPGTGAVQVEKLVCLSTAEDLAGTVDIFIPGEFVAQEHEVPTECRNAVADEFTFTLFNNDLAYSGGEIVAIDNQATDATGQALLTADVDPAIGTRTVFVAEDLTGAESVDLVLVDGTVSEVLIINYVDDLTPVGVTGDVEIAKLYCTSDDLAGQVEFEVLGPEFPVEATGVTAQAGTVEADNCSPGAAEFEIYPFGDKTADPILVTVGSDGIIVINGIIPVTTDLSPHKLVEVSTGAETFFDVEEGAVTKIITINYVGTGGNGGNNGGGTTGGGTTTGGTTGGTTTLPDTGAGAGQSGANYGMALFLVLGGLAAAGVSLRRRAA